MTVFSYRFTSPPKLKILFLALTCPLFLQRNRLSPRNIIGIYYITNHQLPYYGCTELLKATKNDPNHRSEIESEKKKAERESGEKILKIDRLSGKRFYFNLATTRSHELAPS